MEYVSAKTKTLSMKDGSMYQPVFQDLLAGNPNDFLIQLKLCQANGAVFILASI